MKKVLVAASPESAPAAVGALEGAFDVTACKTLSEACRLVSPEIDLIMCGLHFDEGRMFDLLRYTRLNAATKQTPFVCIKSTEGSLSPAIFQSIEIASKALGADAFVEFSDWRRDLGDAKAYEKLRNLVYSLLRNNK